jgi:hypothetical protein
VYNERSSRKRENSPRWSLASNSRAYVRTSSPAKLSCLLEEKEPFQPHQPPAFPGHLCSLRPNHLHLQVGYQQGKHNSMALSSHFDACACEKHDPQPSEELDRFCCFPSLGPSLWELQMGTMAIDLWLHQLVLLPFPFPHNILPLREPRRRGKMRSFRWLWGKRPEHRSYVDGLSLNRHFFSQTRIGIEKRGEPNNRKSDL